MSTYLARSKEVFKRLRAANLKLNICKLFARSVKYLGHVFCDEGVEAGENKVATIREWPMTRGKQDVT